MKKSSPKVTTFKKVAVGLIMVLSIEILFLAILNLTYTQFPISPQTHPLSIHPEEIQTNDTTTEDITLNELEILPESYEDLTKLFGNFSSHELSTFLRYGSVLKDTTHTNITEGYQYLLDSQTNILIPQEYIDAYMLKEIENIATQLQEENKNKDEILPYIQIENENSLINNLQSCIAQDLGNYLKQETCQEEIEKISNEQYAPTLFFLTKALIHTQFDNSNEYESYLSQNKQVYLFNQRYAQEESEHKESDTNILLDIDENHLHRLQLISNYLQILTTKIQAKDDTIAKVETLSEKIDYLTNYSYGSQTPDWIYTILNNSQMSLNTETITDLGLNTNISFLIKSTNIDGKVETFVAPMYIFSKIEEDSTDALEFDINDNNFEEPYDVTPIAQAKGTVRVPIFMYHRIETVPQGQSSFKTGLYVDPLDFEKQMAYLVKKNYKTISMSEYSELLKTGKNPSQKTVVLTFDDGTSSQYINAYPILKKYGLMGVFYIISQRSGINQAQTKEMSDNGMDIGSHSARHPDLTKVTDPVELSAEIVSSKYALQSTTGKTVSSFCYPGCGYNATVLSYVGSAGYTTATSCGTKIDNYPGHAYTLSRVHAFGDMQSFKNLLSGVH